MAGKKLTEEQSRELLKILQLRFEQHTKRHEGIEWSNVETKLLANPDKLWSLNEMEDTEGEPDVIGYDAATDAYIFADCSAESPKGRRSVCYDHDALEARKQNKPGHSALGMAEEMGVEILNEDQYRQLQTLGVFDAKTSSWVKTPNSVRKLGGALFCDYRYATVFTYHNGADSYYAARGFRAMIKV